MPRPPRGCAGSGSVRAWWWASPTAASTCCIPATSRCCKGAAQACDRLIVGLNNDASVRRLKGPTRPVQAEGARAAVLGAIGHVNLVVLFEEDTPVGLIEQLQPDLLVKGADYTIDQIVGADIVQKAGGRVMTVDLVPGQSTTRLIESGSSAALGAGKVRA